MNFLDSFVREWYKVIVYRYMSVQWLDFLSASMFGFSHHCRLCEPLICIGFCIHFVYNPFIYCYSNMQMRVLVFMFVLYVYVLLCI